MVVMSTVRGHLAQVKQLASVGVNRQGFRGRQHEVGGIEVLQGAAEGAKSGIRPCITARHAVMPLCIPPLWGRCLWQVPAERQADPESLHTCPCR